MTALSHRHGLSRTGVVTLLCLPYAGGGAGAFRDWPGRIPPVEVKPVELPGRDRRVTESPELSVTKIADEIASLTGGPYAFYGHSMGARLAFELTRELRRRGLPLPSRLFVGASHPPDRKVPLAAVVDLPDEEFVAELVRRAGAGPELQDEPELRELMLPVLRADLTWIKEHRFTPQPPLPVPVTAFAGAGDDEVGLLDMLGWSRRTSAGFRLHTLRGGHFFVHDEPGPLTELIAADLGGAHPHPPGEDEVHLWIGPRDRIPAPRLGGAHVSASRSSGPVLVAVTAEGPAGVALRGVPGNNHPGNGATAAGPGRLHEVEREQIEDAAEEDRQWLTLRALTAREALQRAVDDPAEADRLGFPDLAGSGPLRACTGRDLDHPAGWYVTLLPMRVEPGEVLGAVALSREAARLRLEILPERRR